MEHKIHKELKKEIKDISKKKAKKATRKALAKHPHFVAQSSFARTLLDPFHYKGVKVPDLSTDPSACFSILDRLTLTIPATGVAGLVFGVSLSGNSPNYTPAGGLVPSQTGVTLPYTYGHQLNTAATAATLYPAGTAVTNLSLANFNSGTSTVAQLFGNVRLVSFGVRIVFTGTALNAQGKVTLARAARNTYRLTDLANGGLTLAKVQKIPDSVVVSVPVQGGGYVCYKPSDYTSFDYVSTTASTAAESGNLGNEIFVIVDGAVSGQTFFVEAVWNFEGLPNTNATSLLDSQPSMSDPISLSVSANAVSALPAAGTLPPQVAKAAIASPVTESIIHHDAPKETSMLDSIVEGMKGVGNVLDTGKNLFGKLSPLLEGAMALL